MTELNDDIKVKNRPKRIPLKQQSVFEYAKEPGYAYYAATDAVGNIEALQLSGWELDPSNKQDTGTRGVQVESQMGTVTKRVANQDKLAPSRYQYLMRKPLEWHLEDVAEAQKEDDKIMEGLDPEKNKIAGADYGEMKIG